MSPSLQFPSRWRLRPCGRILLRQLKGIEVLQDTDSDFEGIDQRDHQVASGTLNILTETSLVISQILSRGMNLTSSMQTGKRHAPDQDIFEVQH